MCLYQFAFVRFVYFIAKITYVYVNDIGIGIKVSFNKNSHQALHTVWPTIIKNNKFISLDWSEIKQKN